MFGIPGDGRYRVQPIYVEDMARLAVALGEQEENVVVDAVGPEVFTFDDLVRVLKEAVGSRARLLHLPPRLAWAAAQVVGWFMGDVILTWDEVRGLMGNLLVSDAAPTGETRFTEWVRENAAWLGQRYASEIARHYR